VSSKKEFLVKFLKFPFLRIEEYWDPVLKGLDPIIVTRQVPAIHILLTLDSVDLKTAGYQKANCPTSFWPEPAAKQQKRDDDYAYKNKRSFNGNSRNQNQRRPQSNQQSSGNNKSKTSAGKPKTTQPGPSQETAKS
jgi:ribonucleases P/MRP protein subunit RPP25